MKNKGYLTPQELANILGKSNQAIYAFLKNKNITSIEISKRKKLIPPWGPTKCPKFCTQSVV